MMSQINRYLFARFASSYLAIAAILTLIIWLIQSLNLIDNVVGSSDSIGQLTGLLSLTIPRVLTFVLAPALLITVIVQFVRMLQTQEYFVLSASGVSPLRILRPVLLLALLVTITQAVLAFYVAPTAMKTLRERSLQSAIGLAAGGLVANGFKDITPTLTVFVGTAQGSSQWQRIMIQDRSSPAHITYVAKAGQVAHRNNVPYFLLKQGAIISNQAGQESDIIRFEEYVLPFNLPTPELQLNRNHMMIHQLFAPQNYGISDPISIKRMQARAHQQVSNLAAPFIFVLLGYLVITFNQLSRSGYAKRMIIAAALGISFQLISTILANNQLSLMWAGAWVLVLVVCVLGQNRHSLREALR